MLPGGIGFSEMLVIGVVAVLLFGSKLPEVARNLGASYNQFRKGLSDIQSSIKKDLDLESSSYSQTTPKNLPTFQDYSEDLEEPSAPKFVPPSADED